MWGGGGGGGGGRGREGGGVLPSTLRGHVSPFFVLINLLPNSRSFLFG